jgi:4-hydroxy-3-methylbut-2-enyl diphosphate reductase
VICTPLRIEQAAVRGTDVRVLRTGMGRGRSAAAAARLAEGGGRPILVAGVGGGLAAGARPGDLVVASEVNGGEHRTASPAAPMLAAALRRLGLRTHVGPVVSRPTLANPATSRTWADQVTSGVAQPAALAVDMESAYLAPGAVGGPFAVVRAIVDTPDRPLLRPGTPGRGIAALRALRRAVPAFEQWAAATGPREVLLAGPRSFCAGVERAIDIVERALDRFGAPVYVRRQIVHNAHVVRQLQDRGAVFVTEVDEVPAGSLAVLAAHGVSPAVREQAAARNLSVIDATCPLVTKVHAEVRRYASRGDTVFLIGHRDHEEVEGTHGEAPGSVIVVEDAADAARVMPRDPGAVAYAMQTTLAVDEADEIAQVLRDRFPSLSAPRKDDICYATTNRQSAVRAVARASGLVLVVGSTNSSNSKRLVEVAEREGAAAYLIDDAGDVDLRWLAGTDRVGITAGASAPPSLVDDLVFALSGLGPVTVREMQVVEEDVHFTLPKEVS